MNVPTTAPEVPVLPLVPSHEETLLREAVSGIAAGFGPAYIRRKVEAEEPPTELWDGAGRARLPRRQHPRGVRRRRARDDRAGRGGGGAGAAGLPAAAPSSSRPRSPGSVLARHGTPEQKERWLRGSAAGDLRVAFAITEPDAGTNTHNLSTRATRAQRLATCCAGTKTFISGVEDAHALFVVARTGTQRETGRGLLSLFIVDADAPGLERRDPDRAARRRPAVAAVLRRRRGGRGPARRRRARRPGRACSTASTRSGS